MPVLLAGKRGILHGVSGASNAGVDLMEIEGVGRPEFAAEVQRGGGGRGFSASGDMPHKKWRVGCAILVLRQKGAKSNVPWLALRA